MAIWKTYRIADIINDIADEKFVLPVIQRPFVWSESKMELLFDTLLRGNSFGGIIVIEEEKDTIPLFNFRAFTNDGNSSISRQTDKLTQLQNFVIDGQQRLQTFYIGLKGTMNGKVLYFDLYSDPKIEFEFKFENDITKLPKRSKENHDRIITEHFWYSAKGLLEQLRKSGSFRQTVKEIIKLNNITNDQEKDCIEENVIAFDDNILNSETLGVSKVSVNKNLPELDNRQRIVELFRRLNDAGTKLSSFDLVASVLKGHAWEMEKFLQETLESGKEIGLSQENLIKLLFILQDNPSKEMAAIENEDAVFAIKNQAKIKSTLKLTVDFLNFARLINYYKDGNRSFIPLFFIAYHIYHNDEQSKNLEKYDTSDVNFSKMKSWLFHSLTNGVFKSKGSGWSPHKSGITKLLEEIKKYKRLDFPVNNLFQVYKNHPLKFTTSYTASNLEQLDPSFLYYCMYDKQKTIRSNDVDHIMPKSILKKLKYDELKINSVKNYQLIDSNTNRGDKKGKPFSEWINSVTSVVDKESFIKLHLIPPSKELWAEARFKEFSEERAKLILLKLKD